MQENRRGMKKSTVIILVISLVMLLAGVGMAVAGVALGGLQELDGVTINGHPIRMGSQQSLAGATVSVEQFKNMDIQANGSQVRFVDDDEYYVQSTYYEGNEPLIDVHDGTLYVRDAGALDGSKVKLTDNKDGTKGILLTDGSGNDVQLDGDGIQITDENGGMVTINGIGIHIAGEDGTDIQVGSPDDPFTIDLSGIDGSTDYEYPEIVIHCPMDKKYGTVSIESDWLESDIEGMQADSMALSIDSGTLTFKDAKIGSLAGNVGFAEFAFEGCELDGMELSGSNLQIAMRDTKVKNDVTLNATDYIEGEGFSGSTVGGDLTIKTESVDSSIDGCTIGGAAEIDCNFGSLPIKNTTLDSLTMNGENLDLSLNGDTVNKDAVITLQNMQSNDEAGITNCTFGTLSIKGENIDLDMSNTTVNGAIAYESTHGDLDMEDVTADGMTAKISESGDLEFTGTLTGKTEITGGGDVELVIRGNKADYSYALNTQYGEATVDDAPYRATVGQNKAPNTIQVDTENGEISLHFQK